MNKEKYLEALNIAIKSLDSNRVRSALTMLGVIIGVFAVVTLISLGRGIENFVADQFNALGSNLVIIAPGKVGLSNDPALNFSANKLDEKHIELIETYASDYILGVTPSIRVGRNIEYKTNSFFPTVIGANEQAPNVLNVDIENGNFFDRADVRTKNHVVVIGNNVKDELFGNLDPVGKDIKIGDESFEVIGVLEPKNQQYDENVIIPYTVSKDIFEVENFSSIGTKIKDPEQIDRAMLNIEMALLRDLDEDDFSVLSQQDILSSIQNILQILTLGLGAIAGISLLVGGIGIMNIMLVSVTERTKEIGLRKAVGANSFDIAIQFIFESMLLSVSGGMIGLMLGFIASYIAQNYIRAQVPLYAVVLAFGFSVIVGVVFGTYPAVQAGKKDPIEALRYE